MEASSTEPTLSASIGMKQPSLEEAVKAQQHDVASSKLTSKIDSKGKAKNQTELKSKSKPKIKRWGGCMTFVTPREAKKFREKYQGKVPLDWFDGRGKLRARHIAERLRESQRAASGGSVNQGSVPAVGARVSGGDGETKDDAEEESNCDVGEMEE